MYSNQAISLFQKNHLFRTKHFFKLILRLFFLIQVVQNFQI